jgi:hypothetical protein
MTPFRQRAHLAIEQLGKPVFPVTARTKTPCIDGGFHAATLDGSALDEWGTLYPDALAAIPTGSGTGIVVVDLDLDETVNAWDSLEALGVSTCPTTPVSETPSGGCHLWFAHPGPGIYVKTIAGKVGPGIDIRGDGGSVIFPAGPGRRWDPHLGPSVPLAPLPAWAIPPEPPAPKIEHAPRPTARLSRYAEVALDNAVKRICAAPAGQQETTLNTEAYSIGRLAGGGVIPAGLALESLIWAAQKMPSHDTRRPWRPVDLHKKVRLAFMDGLAQPRSPS